MIIAVSGSRDFNDEKFICNEINKYYTKDKDIIHVGDCKGVDYVVRKNFECKVFYADWNKHGLAAGPIRNSELLKGSDILIAFLKQGSKGTLNCIKSAQKLGIKIIQVDI